MAGRAKARRINESILYDRAVERQSEEEELRIAANKLTAHIARPGSDSFRQRYYQTAFGTRRSWSIWDMNEMAIEAGAPDEDCLAFAHAYLARVEQRLAVRAAKQLGQPESVAKELRLETIIGAEQDMATADAVCDLTAYNVQKVFDQTLRLERQENRVLSACRAFLAARAPALVR